MQSGDPLTIHIAYEASQPTDGVVFMFEIRDVKEQVMIQWDSQIIGQSFDVPAGHGQVDFTCDAFPFLDGAYSVVAGIRNHSGGVTYDYRELAARFEVMHTGRSTGVVNVHSGWAQPPCRMSATLEPASDSDEDAYLARVLSEIEAEVRAKRASGELPARVERELDELFLEFSPSPGARPGLHDALRMVDAATFIDPVVPVGSAKSGGAVVKKGLRSLSLCTSATSPTR